MNRISGLPFASRSEVIAQNGMAATSQPLATQIALDILKQGGNAIDAAIAANAALGLMEPTGCGIGGDLFAMVWEAKTQKLHGINGSGRSPMSLSLDYFRENQIKRIPAFGPLSVSVPGAVDAWFELHGKFGVLPMANLLAPTIQYAEKGFPLSELIAYYLGRFSRAFQKWPHFAETYMPNAKILQKGDVFANPRLAKTLQLIAQKGRAAFYEGEIAQKIHSHMQSIGGFLSYEDLKAHQSEWINPVSTNYRGYDVWQLPPNGQGIAVLQMLNLLEGYDIAAMGFGSAEYLHLLTEAKKIAYEDRAKFYADMAFNEVPVARLISKSYAKERRALFDPKKAGQSFPAGRLSQGDTIYLTTADKAGNMVSLIQSNYKGMGSGVMAADLGFMLQNRGELFSLQSEHFNVYAPKKRPFHTIIPGFVSKDGKPFMSFGLMGGGMQPQGHVQILVNMIDFGMNLQEAGDAARIRHDGSSQPTDEQMTDGGVLHLEKGFEKKVISKLRLMGHEVQLSKGGYGGYQAIKWDEEPKVYFGASESRKDGQAAGY